ncbi:MAG TPA: hypothetical protein VFS43_46155 [Polyangiaceae bacterium]|nr:hypothetical protein [Polyangiaceae bacterium]
MLSARLALRLALALAASALPTLAACSFLVEDSIEQCQTDGDCAGRRDGYVCDRGQGVCVRDPAQAGAGGSGDPALCNRADKEVEEITGDIDRNRTLYCSKDYILSGYVKVLDGVTLTVQPGTRVLGRGSVGISQPPGTLLVLPGGKLEAVGRPDAPIVFTSASSPPSRGDWGGVALLGNAPINLKDGQGNPALGTIDGVVEPITYGGLDPDDSSGILKYVRIEYAGLATTPNDELNGLTLAGVGSGTEIDYVQVRETVDDCFAFQGGTVDVKHLICQRAGDDGFDLEQGYTGRMQFLVMQQDLDAGEFLPNGLEAENDPNLAPNEPFTEPRVYNATLCGRGPQSTKDLEHYGLLLRQGAKGHFFNLLVSGFDAGLDIGDDLTVANITEGSLELGASIFFENLTADVAHNESASGDAELEDDDGGFNENAWVDGGTGNGTERPAAFVDCFDPRALRLRPTGAIAQGAATPPNDGFFDASATYYGAFRDENDTWAQGAWVVWDDKLGPPPAAAGRAPPRSRGRPRAVPRQSTAPPAPSPPGAPGLPGPPPPGASGAPGPSPPGAPGSPGPSPPGASGEGPLPPRRCAKSEGARSLASPSLQRRKASARRPSS